MQSFKEEQRELRKPFLSEHCKEKEGKLRIRKTRELFKKIGDTKGIYNANMDTRKDRNGKDLSEAEEIKKRWQENMEELYKKCLKDPDNNDGVTHLEPDILEYEVKWALRSTTTKLVEAMEFQLSYFKF